MVIFMHAWWTSTIKITTKVWGVQIYEVLDVRECCTSVITDH